MIIIIIFITCISIVIIKLCESPTQREFYRVYHGKFNIPREGKKVERNSSSVAWNMLLGETSLEFTARGCGGMYVFYSDYIIIHIYYALLQPPWFAA